MTGKGRLLRAWAALILLLVGSPPAKSADIFVDKSRPGRAPLVAVIGEIERGDSGRFSALVAGLPNAVVGLESPGGNMMASIEIGEIIRERGFTTIVPDKMTCASGCALIWLAGARRYVWDTARIGFHGAFDPTTMEQSGLGNRMIAGYLVKLGLSSEAVAYMTAASPTDMRWLHSGDAKRLGIAADELSSTNADRGIPDKPRDTASQLKSEAVTFVMNFFSQLNAASRSGSISALATAYSDSVEYLGSNKTSREVLSDKQNSLRWWPVQIYSVRQETLRANCVDANSGCIVTGIVDWRFESPGRSMSALGNSRFSLYLAKASPERFLIVREDATVLSNQAGR
jgi:uncharacterized protein YaiE (UPF0345 family)